MSDPKPEPQSKATARAMDMKESNTPTAQPGADRTPSDGMNPVPNPEIAPSGALDAEGHRPVLERSRKSR